MTHTFTFTFTTRASYLVYVADWKQRYADQSAKQRQLKLAIREQMKADNSLAFRQAYKEQYAYIAGTALANKLIDERHASKVEAQKQYTQNKSDSRLQA